MTTFAFLVLLVQACLVQNAYSRCAGPVIQTATASCCSVPNYAPAVVSTCAPACSACAIPAVVPTYVPTCAPACAPAVLAPTAYAVSGSCGCGCQGRYY